MGNVFFSDATESMQLLKECFLNDPHLSVLINKPKMVTADKC